jgi:colicin import membrane protein
MQAADRPAFAPPPEPGRARAFGLALVAHALLVGALTWGVNWKREDRQLAAEAELWSATVQEAAPRLQEELPPPPPPPAPPVQAAPPPPAPAVRDADIALQREKKRQEELKKKQDAEREKQKKLEAEKAEAKKKLAEQKRLEEQRKRELAEKAQKAEQAEKARKDAAEAKKLAAQREENLRRMQGLAGATGGAMATGNALRSAGPSDSYGGRIRARVKPNIVFTEEVSGNPVAEVEVRMAPDGTITSRKVTKSSGVKAWDDAVLRALDRTEVLPRDLDGRVHSPLILEFRPKG